MTSRHSPRALLHLLYNGARAVDAVQAALELKLLEPLEAGWVTPDELAAPQGLVAGRVAKLLECLESLGLVQREQPVDERAVARYRAEPGLREAAEAVLGPHSLERDRERHPWRQIHGRLPEVLRGEHAMPREAFDWPPRSPEQQAAFEASMAAGLGPILETLRPHGERLFTPGLRLLDVGGGNGTLAAHLLEWYPTLQADIFNLPACEALVAQTREARGLQGRLGFVAGDFLQSPLPSGYQALSFIRVLHDWPADTARALLRSAFKALPPGGLVLICEEFRTPARLAAQFFWSYFLIGVDSCSSKLREVDFYLHALEETGFGDLSTLPGPFELIVGRTPPA